MIWSLIVVSSAVQSTDVHLKLRCLALSNMRLQKAINVSPSFCMFDQKWKCLSVMFLSHQCVFFHVFSSGAAMHQSVYNLLAEYIPRNLETLLRDFVCSQISSHCSNCFGFQWFSIAASKNTLGGSGYNASYCSWKHWINSWNAFNIMFSGCLPGSKNRRERASSKATR